MSRSSLRTAPTGQPVTDGSYSLDRDLGLDGSGAPSFPRLIYLRSFVNVVASVHIATSLQKALDGFLGFIPNLLGFLVILIIGFLIARAVRARVSTLLKKA